MNKILIVGHPQSGYQGVERLLRTRGMARALPSRREGLMPDQIGAMLCQVHGTSPLHRLGSGCAVEQIGAGPVWHGLALDLMLGNLDQPLWGWCDPNAVHLLEYWRELDPGLHFLFVYDQPHSALTRMPGNGASGLSPRELQQRLEGWTAYNACLLDFHNRHPQRSLLVHATQVARCAESTLRRVRARIVAPWTDRVGGTVRTGDLSSTDLRAVEDAVPTDLDKAFDGEPVVDDGPLAELVARTLVKGQPGSLTLYEALQAAADLPLAPDAAPCEDTAPAVRAWQELVAGQARHRQLRQLARQLQAGRDEARRRADSHERQLQDERQLRDRQQRDAAGRAVDLTRSLDRLRIARADGDARNARLMDQIHTVQQALEQQHRLTLEQTNRYSALEAREKQTRERALAAAALQGQLQRLQQDFDTLQARAATAAPPADLVGENARLWQQLLLVQETLGRVHQENQRLKATPPPAASAVLEPMWFGAADRVRNDLSYRLGARMIQLGRRPLGWLAMPWALASEARRHRRDQAARAADPLPPVERYRDAHEAERVRQHLSYRLGQAYLAHTASPLGWWRLPAAIRREMKAFRDKRGH